MLRILLVTTLILLSVPAAQAAICSVDIGDIDLGDVDAIGNAEKTSTSEITIQCDGATESTITVCGHIGAGDGGIAGSYRLARSGPDELAFGFLTSSSGGVAWGSSGTPALGQPNRFTLNVTDGSATGEATLHAVVPGGQATAPVGTYHAGFSATDVAFTYDEGDHDCASLSGASVANASFSVDAAIVANCRLETSDLSFGTTGRIGDNIDAETGLDLICTAGTGYGIAIDGGGAGDPANRRLVAGDNSVRYDLYSNAERTSRWGMDDADMVTGDGDGETHEYSVYGRIPPQQAATGAYTDTVVVTLFYE